MKIYIPIRKDQKIQTQCAQPNSWSPRFQSILSTFRGHEDSSTWSTLEYFERIQHSKPAQLNAMFFFLNNICYRYINIFKKNTIACTPKLQELRVLDIKEQKRRKKAQNKKGEAVLEKAAEVGEIQKMEGAMDVLLLLLPSSLPQCGGNMQR